MKKITSKYYKPIPNEYTLGDKYYVEVTLTPRGNKQFVFQTAHLSCSGCKSKHESNNVLKLWIKRSMSIIMIYANGEKETFDFTITDPKDE